MESVFSYNRFYLVVQDGLERRGYKESGFLREVAEVVETGMDLPNNFLVIVKFFSLSGDSEILGNIVVFLDPNRCMIKYYLN
jgi:hypothetical protein